VLHLRAGCVTSFLNSAFFLDIGTVVLDTLDINFCDTIQAAPGMFLDGHILPNSAEVALAPKSYVLLVEGACPIGVPGLPSGPAVAGDYCHIGDIAAIGDERYSRTLKSLADNAAAVLAIGTCSSFGGIPAARGNSTGAMDTRTFLTTPITTVKPNADLEEARGSKTGTATPIVRVPGCPPHPDWIVGTVLQYLASPGALVGALNSDGAPREYFGEYMCNAGPCTWRYNNVQRKTQESGGNNNFSSFPDSDDVDTTYTVGNSKGLGKNKWKGADIGCLGILGCKGRKTKADCSGRHWNTNAKEEYGNKMSWCVGSRGGCHGCTNPAFPDGVGKFFTIA